MNFQYQIVERENITDQLNGVFSKMLKAQNKVRGNLKEKAYRCKLICFVYSNSEPVAIGAIKQKTKSDFSVSKADLMSREAEFDWELGYIYTAPLFARKGIAGEIINKLLNLYGDGNLMATTEVSKNPAMVHLLERNGFTLSGKKWKSTIHDNYLGLYLRNK
ncbi:MULTISPECIES: GNAT family N-acetyltransferase [Enterobacteriaceae]|uniref:GNAT family N-acetyltransferase n=1 Tax=Enterobacteriaceae TaxID=543 RepID=UPI0012C13A59|nr:MULTISPECIES: GNAT family protein [Enterobacteriaceae]ECD9465476.1 GNAT family N-acetyltransferase [Salmonella enterica subsp. diarizonae]EGY9631414.1 GNAT family N-acetyltransferase [Salmonella enterica subsp. enterica serovar Rough O:c:z]EEI9890293.1 GNAT family N-acetyltransferase [Salmonella enterica subsp. diarizonae]EEU6580184.1 GNAT family N-acetyltransferase [Salmonella enterica]EGY1555430.1 GNAT family N-acetyltransferase [Salmonella enterica]